MEAHASLRTRPDVRGRQQRGVDRHGGFGQDLLDVVRVGPNVAWLSLPVGVGRSEEEIAVPRHGEGHADVVLRNGQCRGPLAAAGDEYVRPLAQAHGSAGVGILQPANRVDPWACRVDAHPRAHRDVVPVDVDLGTDDLPAGRAQRDDRRVVEHGRTGFCGGAHIRQAQAGIVRPGVRVQGTRTKPVESERRHHPAGSLRIDEPVQPRPRERRVEEDPALHERRAVRASFVQRQEERDPVHEMRRNELR